MSTPSLLDPLAVRRQFARRPQRIARADFLLREVERRMLERLDVVRLQPELVVDVGCGLGAGAARLQQRYDRATVLGVDAAAPMALAAARAHGRPAQRSLAQRLHGWFGASVASAGPRTPLFACADAARLPLPDARVDLVWSNLAWHWFADPVAVLAEWQRVIRPGGLVAFTSFGVDTLRPLAAAGVALPPLPDLHDIGDQLVAAGFADPVVDAERLTVTWTSAQALLDDLRALGGNALRARARGLAGRAARARWLDALERVRGEDDRIALGFELVHGHAWCPSPKRRRDGWSPVQIVPRASR
jgi:malonyl-CoA O-methyltransferase